MDLVALVRCLDSPLPTVACSGCGRALIGVKSVGGLIGLSGWGTVTLLCWALTNLSVDMILFLAIILSAPMTLFVDIGFSFISGCGFRLWCWKRLLALTSFRILSSLLFWGGFGRVVEVLWRAARPG